MKRIYLLTSILLLACSESDDGGTSGTDGTSGASETTEASSTGGATDSASSGSTSDGSGGSSSGGAASTGSGSTGGAGGLYSPCDFPDDPICGDGTCLVPAVGIKGVCTQACNSEDDVCPEHAEGAPTACRLNQTGPGDWWCLPDCVEGMACPEDWMCEDFFLNDVLLTNVCWPQ